jgi:hypothetical protein
MLVPLLFLRDKAERAGRARTNLLVRPTYIEAAVPQGQRCDAELSSDN